MSDKLISILMPFKNEERYLEDCIESVISQSIENWELIAVDDHSSDISSDIVKRHAQKDQRIKCFHNNGHGVIEALKTALINSNGDLIHRMDADDIMPERKLENLSTTLLKAGRGNVSTGKVKYFSGSGISKGYLEYEQWLNSLCDNENHWKNIFRECVIASPAWMMYKEDLEKIGGFNSDLYPEDYDLVFRMYENGLKVKSSDKVVHYWREHEERISRNHQNYSQEAFFRLKLHYFIKYHFQKERNLVFLGMGTKHKIVKKILDKWKIDFIAIDKKENLDLEKLDKRSQYIILFADNKSQNQLKKNFDKREFVRNEDYFFLS